MVWRCHHERGFRLETFLLLLREVGIRLVLVCGKYIVAGCFVVGGSSLCVSGGGLAGAEHI